MVQLSQSDLRVLWDAWRDYAPPDAQVAHDAAKERGEAWALLEYPPYVKYYLTLNRYRYVTTSGMYQMFHPIMHADAEYYAQSPCAIKSAGYLNWKEAILGSRPK